MSCSESRDFHIFPKEFGWQSELTCFENDPPFSFSFKIFSSTLLVISISNSFGIPELINEGLLVSTCLSLRSPQNDASCGWQDRCFCWALRCNEVGKNKALVVAHHQDRHLIGQLEPPRAEMAGMGDAREELPGGELFMTVPSGILFKSDWSS